jgi:LysR family glycine cleavage system transcriptional activator
MAALPPIQLLVAFEAAARLSSFKLAASELHLTPSAVSQQIKALEGALGVPLFERRPRAVELTRAGAQYLAVARDTLSVFTLGTERLLRRARARIVRISAAPFVAHEVLIPHLSEIRDARPDLEVRIEASSRIADLRVEPIDVGVRFGRGPWPGLHGDWLSDVVVTPVASPALARRVKRTRDLAKHTLLDVRGQPDYWAELARAEGFVVQDTLSFDSYFDTVRAAEHGLGIALGVFPLTTSWVRARRLAIPLALRIPSRIGHHAVCRTEQQRSPEIASIRAWIRARFAALEPLDP